MSSETINVIIADDFEPITVGIAGGSGGGKVRMKNPKSISLLPSP